MTINDGTVLAFGSAYGYRIFLGGHIIFANGGGITYNGNVGHSFFNGRISGRGVVYRLNATVAGGRQDFFSPSTSSDGLKNFTFVYGGGASGANYYTHLENFGGKFDGLTFVNDVTSSLGSGAISIQLDGGTYRGVTFPRTTSAAGITSTVQIWLPRNSNKTTVLESPVMPETVLTVVGDCTNGAADLINETWPDLPKDTVGALAVGSRNLGETIISRKITWTPGSYVGWAVRLADSQVTPTVYNAGAIASDTGINLTWAKWARSTQVQTLLGPFRITARHPGYKERTGITFAPVQPLTEAFLPEADPYYTQDQTALADINADAATKAITLTAQTTLDKINDWFDGWLALPAQLASVPVTPKSHSAKTLVLGGGWALIGAQFAAPGAKLADFVDANNAGSLPVDGADDTDTVRVRRAADDTVLMQRLGSGAMRIKPADVGAQVYVQRVSAAGRVRGETDTLVLAAGANAVVPLFFGAKVQVAQAPRIELLPTQAQMRADLALVEARLMRG